MAYEAIKRNHTGHRIGACHQHARHGDDVVRMARILRAAGKTYAAIGNTLGVSPWTIRDWCVLATRWDV